MKHSTRLWISIVAGSCAVISACGGSSTPSPGGGDGSLARVQKAGVLKVCSVDGLLPYSSSDPSEPGFEVLIAQAVASQLGVKDQEVFTTFDGLVAALLSKRCDVIIDGLFITTQREKAISFSAPYYASGEAILVQKDNNTVHGIQDLVGKNVGVLSGSVTVSLLQNAHIGNLKIYPDQNTIILELSNGRIDAGFLEAPSAAWALQQQATLNVKLVKSYVPSQRFDAGIGVRKEDVQLREALSTAVNALIANGSIARFLNEYGVPFYPVVPVPH